MAERLSTGLRNEVLRAGGQSLADVLADGVLAVFEGTQPASADDDESGYTKLVEISLNSGTFVSGVTTYGINLDVAANGTVSKAAAEVWSGVGLVSGTAGWFRFYPNDRDNHLGSDALGVKQRIDGAISTSGAEINMSNTAIVASATSTLDGFSVTWPGS